MDPEELLRVLEDAARAVTVQLSGLQDWGLAGTKPGQYCSDLVADEAARSVLLRAGLAVLSEESGLHEPGRPLIAVLDPVDGSTNASRHLPWFATSICVLDDTGPLAALVVNQASGISYQALRGRGARRDGKAIVPSGARVLGESLVGISGFPQRHLGWRQFRCLGAAALDLCAVAEGALDGYIDCIDASHGPWDYLGGMLVCLEAGACVGEVAGRDLVIAEHEARRSPVAGATQELLDALVVSRRAAQHH